MAAPQLVDNNFQPGQTAPDAMKAAMAPMTDLTDADTRSLGALLRINTALQTTLDIHALITLFAKELGRLLTVDSIRYQHAGHGLNIGVGKAGRHSCSYKLIVGDDHLGELKISRRRKFLTGETILIEHVVCALIYPLRNALTYLAALRAAHKDPLTGTSNRAAMDNTLVREVELARRHCTALSMIVIDIDLFKSINDTYGHSVGDEVIKSITGLIGRAIRKSDMLFRFGGEEFVVLLSNTGDGGARLLAERIRRGVEQTTVLAGCRHVPVTVSLGVASLDADDTAQSLFEKADRALYVAKAGGRNCVRSARAAPALIADTV